LAGCVVDNEQLTFIIIYFLANWGYSIPYDGSVAEHSLQVPTNTSIIKVSNV